MARYVLLLIYSSSYSVLLLSVRSLKSKEKKKSSTLLIVKNACVCVILRRAKLIELPGCLWFGFHGSVHRRGESRLLTVREPLPPPPLS